MIFLDSGGCSDRLKAVGYFLIGLFESLSRHTRRVCFHEILHGFLLLQNVQLGLVGRELIFLRLSAIREKALMVWGMSSDESSSSTTEVGVAPLSIFFGVTPALASRPLGETVGDSS